MLLTSYKTYTLKTTNTAENNERRHKYIESLLTNFLVKENLSNYLNEIYDLERLIGRISYGNLNARDMYQLLKSLEMLPSIKEELEKISYDKELNIM